MYELAAFLDREPRISHAHRRRLRIPENQGAAESESSAGEEERRVLEGRLAHPLRVDSGAEREPAEDSYAHRDAGSLHLTAAEAPFFALALGSLFLGSFRLGHDGGGG